MKPGTTTTATICHTDLLATVADITSYRLPANAGEDSVSFLSLMQGSKLPLLREATVHHSVNGSFAIRKGDWKLIFCPGSGGWSAPRPPAARKQKLPAVQLYNLSSDIGERTNLQQERPEKVKELTSLLQRYIKQGRSTPGAKQKNDARVAFGR